MKHTPGRHIFNDFLPITTYITIYKCHPFSRQFYCFKMNHLFNNISITLYLKLYFIQITETQSRSVYRSPVKPTCGKNTVILVAVRLVWVVWKNWLLTVCAKTPIKWYHHFYAHPKLSQKLEYAHVMIDRAHPDGTIPITHHARSLVELAFVNEKYILANSYLNSWVSLVVKLYPGSMHSWGYAWWRKHNGCTKQYVSTTTATRATVL